MKMGSYLRLKIDHIREYEYKPETDLALESGGTGISFTKN
jgi:hypothetical protein